MKGKVLLFAHAVTDTVVEEKIQGLKISDDVLEKLSQLPSKKTCEIHFLIGTDSIKRTCYILSTERPLRSDQTPSENCLKFKMWYYNSAQHKMYACVKINLTEVAKRTPKNDMFFADSEQQLDELSEKSILKQKKAAPLATV